MSTVETVFLKNLWDPSAAEREASPLDLLRYRSNLLGEDLRITNFGGGNTSSKFDLPDPLTGAPQRVMAVKGSGGDLRSIRASGFALLYLDKLESLIARYRGEAHEDEMVAFYPLCAFGENRVAASIDTPLHAFLPFPHVDHLHPGLGDCPRRQRQRRSKLEEFNQRYGRHIVVGAMAAPRVRAGVDAASAPSSRTPGATACARWPRTVHVGRHAARLLPEQHQDDRSDGRVRRGARATRGGRRSSAARGSGRGGGPRAAVVSILPSCAARCRRSAGWSRTWTVARCAGVRQLGVGRGPVRDGHELSGSFPADPHLADVHSLGSGDRSRRASCRTDPERDRDVPRGLRGLLPARSPSRTRRSSATATRPSSSSRAWAVRLWQGQARSADHDGVLRQRHPRDGGANALEDGGAPAARCRRSRRPEQAEPVQDVPQLRRAAARRGIPDRVLGARGSQAAADAAGEGVQPQSGRGRWRGKRHRP